MNYTEKDTKFGKVVLCHIHDELPKAYYDIEELESIEKEYDQIELNILKNIEDNTKKLGEYRNIINVQRNRLRLKTRNFRDALEN